jgi:hypothetical protein
MPDIRTLINKLADEEAALHATHFIAPCVPSSRVCVRVSGLRYTFRPAPADFEGWGIFQPRDAQTAEVVGAATLPQVSKYLQLFKALHLRLVARLRGRTWLAYPVNEADARPSGVRAEPITVRLVSGAQQFEQIVARYDGAQVWHEDLDRRADPRIAERLRKLLRQRVLPPYITWQGITPETRTAYALAVTHAPEFGAVRQRARAEARLRGALALSGGTLCDYEDRADHWLVNWHTRAGEVHTSAIAKRDLTVLSAGICLSDQDRLFDLQSLVGVVERQWE